MGVKGIGQDEDGEKQSPKKPILLLAVVHTTKRRSEAFSSGRHNLPYMSHRMFEHLPPSSLSGDHWHFLGL